MRFSLKFFFSPCFFFSSNPVRVFFIYTMLLQCISSIGYSQASTCQYTMQGHVWDVVDGESLAYAQVFCEELGLGTMADSNGYYQLKSLCKGDFIFICNHVGCESMKVRVAIEGNTTYDFYHQRIAEVTSTVQIMSQAGKLKSASTSQELNQRELQLSEGSSLGEMLKAMSGVSSLRTGSNVSKPVVHGLHSNRVLILNNGVRQEGQQWGNEHAPEIDPFIAEKITVVKGANAVRYGSDAIGGVVLVEPAALQMIPGISGKVHLVAFTNGRQGISSAVLNGQLKKMPRLSWRLQGTLKQAGDIKASAYYLKNTGVKELNYSAAARYSKGRFNTEIFYSQFNSVIGIYTDSHIGNLTDLNKAINQTAPREEGHFSYRLGRPYQQINHELVKLKTTIRTNKGGKLGVVYARQYNLRNEYDKHLPLNDSLAALNKPALQFEITTHTADLIWEHSSFRLLKGTIGISTLFQGNTYQGRFFIPNFKKSSQGVFIIEHLHLPNNKWDLEAGIRYDMVTQQVFLREGDDIVKPLYNYNSLSANAGAIKTINESNVLRINFATAWRPPAINELYSNGLHHGAGAIEVGNRLLSEERSHGLFASWQHRTNTITIIAESYSQYINQFIYLRPTNVAVLTIRGAFPEFRYVQTDVWMNGSDLKIQWEATARIRFKLKASLVRAMDLNMKEFLFQMPADNYEPAIEFHSAKWRKARDLFFNTSYSYVNKQWRVPAQVDYASPPQAYALLNMQFGFAFKLNRQQVNIAVGVENALNKTYRDYMNRFRYYTDEQGRNISLRITIPFGIKNYDTINTE